MRINFLLPSLDLAGATRAVFEYANRLALRGHAVRILYLAPESEAGLWRVLQRMTHRRPVPWFQVNVPVTPLPAVADEYLPAADATLACGWTLARDLARCSRRSGVPVFLIQNYDVFEAPEEEANEAWRLPMPKIAVSSWLMEVGEKLDACAWGPLVYGVDQQRFYGTPRLRSSAHRIGMVYHSHPSKGFADGRLAFEMARKKHPSIRLVLYGAARPDIRMPEAEFHLRPAGEALRQIYTSCDVWLLPSWTEGCPTAAMEALACACTLVTTDVGGIRDIVRPGTGALVSPPRDPIQLADNLTRVLGDAHLRLKMAETGQAGVRPLTWERSTAELEDLLERARRGGPEPGSKPLEA